MFARVLLLSTIIAVLSCNSVRADPIDANVGITLDGLAAHHELNGGINNLIVPFPMLTADVDYHAVGIDVQALPALPVSLGGGSQQTQLGVFLATARYYVTRRFMVGIGSTVLNQVSNFAPMMFGGPPLTFADTTTERSRVVGARFTTGYIDKLHGVELVVAFSPSMHGKVHDECFETSSLSSGSTACFLSGKATIGSTEAENASEIDADLRIWRPLGRHAEWMYGWRYLNFVGSIRYPTHLDTDQNRGTGPSVGIRWHL